MAPWDKLLSVIVDAALAYLSELCWVLLWLK
jgi:hypothetical protein